MSNVYQEKPNIVEVSIKDKAGAATRFIVGQSLDEVIKFIDDGDDQSVHQDIEIVIPKKERKPRRTKAEIAAELKFKQQQEREDRESLAGATPQTTGKSAGESAMDRLKKEAAEKAANPTETVWP